MKILYAAFWLLLLAPLQLLGQSWTGLLAPARATDWTQAGATIPTVTTACATQPTLLTGTGNGAANVTAINNAFNADKGGSLCVINLPAGTYYMSGSWVFNYSGKANVVLRGAGANSTFINWQDAPLSNTNGLGGAPIFVTNGDNNDAKFTSNIQNWTAGYSQGATTVTLAANTGLKVGTVLWLLQADPVSDNGNAWACQTSVCAQAAGLPPTGFSQNQSVMVTGCGTTTYGASCSSNTITIIPGLYAPNWNSGQSPQGRWSSNLAIQNVGFENFSVDASSIVTSNRLIFIFMLNNTANNWLSGMRTINGTVTGQAAHSHVFVSGSVHPTVKDSYFYGSNPASEGYGFSPSDLTSDALFQNNICQHIASCVVMQTAVGSVFGYNYAVDNYFGSGWQQCDLFHHSAGDAFDLFEGNVGTCWTNDSLHGTSYAITLHRNALSGFDASAATPPGSNLLTINNMAFARYANYTANVLAYGGHATTYQYVMSSATDCGAGGNGFVYAFDDSGQTVAAYNPCDSGSGPNNDVRANARPSDSTMRWGNWDKVSNAVRAVSGENGSTASTYPALSSPSTSYASYPSFYLAGSPSWWVFPSGSAAPFPGIGPDVAGGNIANTSGHAWLNPAANCYRNVMSGVATPQAFDPAACYPAGGIVSAPTFSPSPGAYGAAQTVTLSSSTSGATICYTTDGSTPTANGAGTCVHGSIYSVPFSVSSSTTVKAIGSKSAFTDSGVSSGLYTINGSAAAPTFSPGAGSYGGTQTVTITSTTAGSTICYTSDGSTPTADGNGTCTHGTTYAAPVSVSTSQTLKAIASKATFLDSSVASAAYVINGTASTPTFSPVAGSYGPTQNVTITTSTSGATICYTTNGSSPTSSSPGVCAAGSTQYVSAVAVATSLTLKSIATKAGFTDSSVGSAAYVINGAVATPTLTPGSGSYGAAQTVTLATATGSATLHYTTDGSTPTCSSTTYSTPITVSTSQTVNVIGCKSGFSDSAIGTATYAINGTLPTPTFAPAGGSYGSSQTVTISAAAGSSVVLVNTMQETSNASDTLGHAPHRNAYTNCIETCSGNVPAPSPAGTLWCTSSAKSTYAGACPSFAANAVVSATLTGTGLGSLENGNGAGGSDSLTSLTATYAGSGGTGKCDVGTNNNPSGYIPGLTMPGDQGLQLINTVVTGSPGNSSDLIVTKYNSSADSGRYIVRQDCALATNGTTVGGSHYEWDDNYNTTGGTYMGFGMDFDLPNSKIRACPQGCSGWTNIELCPVGGGSCLTTYSWPAGDYLYSEKYVHWDAGCTFSSSSACAHYDAMCLQLWNAGSPVNSLTCYNVRNASTHGTIDFIPINKTSWTHPQYGIQHQWDINQSSKTLTATIPFSNSVAYYTTSGTATICYTTDGSTPTGDGAGNCTHGTTYTGAITVSSTTTVKAIATQAGFTDSTVGSATYTINGTAGTPTFSPVAGTYSSTQSVAISSSTAGSTLCYTSDGSTPTADGAGTCTHGTTYSGAVSVPASITLKAIASKSGFTDSGVGSAAYIITIPPTAPIISGHPTISGAPIIK